MRIEAAFSHFEWVRQSEGNKVPGIIGFPGMGSWRPSAAHAVTRRKTTTMESNHYEGSTPVVICSTSTQNALPVEAIRLGTDCSSMSSPAMGW